jgi:hypothetical protein
VAVAVAAVAVGFVAVGEKLRKMMFFAVWEPLRVSGSGWVGVSDGVGCAGRRRSFWC